MKNELRDVLIAQLEKVNKVNAELKLRLSDVIKSLPDSEEIRIKARELDEKDFDHCHTCLPPSEKDSVLSLVHTARTPSLVHHPSADVHRRLLPSFLNSLFLFSSPLSPDLELAKATTEQGQGCTHMWVIRSYISPQAVNILRSLNYTLF